MTSIFLSYARGDDEPFVERLYHALLQRGFDVWWDRVCMSSRLLTFHQEIREAVAARERLVLVVSPRAVTSDYVWQEWKFALEHDKVVTPILRLEDYPLVPDELRLFHTEDFRDDARFDFHFDNLVRQLAEPPPSLGKLIAVPSLPAHYLERADHLNALRDTLRADLDRPVVIGGAAARVGVHGMGGIGKSMLAAGLARDRKVREAFPDGIVWIGLGSLPDVPALQRRVHRDLGGDGAFATEHQGKMRLKELLADKAVLLILDDVWRRADVDWFDVLGPRCRALVTTRDMGLLTSLGGTHHVVELLTDHEAQSVLALAAGVPRDELPSEAAQIVTECGRLPLAVALAGGMIQAGTPWRDVLNALRKHKLEFLEDEHAAVEQHRNLWRTMEVSVLALPQETQQRLAELAVFPTDAPIPEAAVLTLWDHTGGLEAPEARRLLVKLKQRSLVQLTQPLDAPADHVGDFSLHDLLHDFCVRLARRAFGDDVALHSRLLDAYRKQCPDGWQNGPNDGYFFTHLRQHLIAARRAVELADLLHEWRWLEAKNEAGLPFDLTADFRDALDALPTDDSRAKILRLLDEALRRDLHFIARHSHDYPQALFQCLWNFCWWYDCPEAVQHYEPPEAGATREPPPWEQPGRPLSALMESWRCAKTQGRPGFRWLRSLRPPKDHLGTPLKTVFQGHTKGVTSVACSPDGRRIVTGSQDTTVRIWDTDTGAELLCLRGHEKHVDIGGISVAYSPDGRRIVSVSPDQTVRVWDAESGAELLCLRGHKSQVSSVAFSRDGRRIISGGWDNTVRVWDADSSAEVQCLRGHDDWVYSVAYSPDGQRIVSGSRDRTVRVWDAESGAELLCLRGHKDVEAVAFSPDARQIVSGSIDRTVRVWDADSGTELRRLRGHGWDVTSIAFSPDARRIVSGSWDKTVRVWDADSSAEVQCLRGHDAWVYSVAFSPDGRRILSGARDTVRVWDADSDTELRCLRGYTPFGMSVFSPDGRRIVSGLWDRTVRVWDADSGAELLCLRGHDDDVTSVAYSPDGRRIISGSRGPNRGMAAAYGAEIPRSEVQMLMIWDTDTGAELHCLRGHDDDVTSVAYSPDSQRIVSGSWDNTVRVWDAESGVELLCLRGHEYHVEAVAFSPDGRRIVSGSVDRTVRVWDAESGVELLCLRGHESTVTRVAFSPDGRRIVSGSGTMRVWDAESGEDLEVIKAGGDLGAIALGTALFPLRALKHDLETVIEPATTGEAVAWWPIGLRSITTHPSGRIWTGAADHYLCLFTLEGDA